MDPLLYFSNNDLVIKKKYDALKDFFFFRQKAESVAKNYGYSISAFYSLIRDFKKHLKDNPEHDFFFQNKNIGRQHVDNNEIDDFIISLRKKNFSTEDIVNGFVVDRIAPFFVVIGDIQGIGTAPGTALHAID